PVCPSGPARGNPRDEGGSGSRSWGQTLSHHRTLRFMRRSSPVRGRNRGAARARSPQLFVEKAPPPLLLYQTEDKKQHAGSCRDDGQGAHGLGPPKPQHVGHWNDADEQEPSTSATPSCPKLNPLVGREHVPKIVAVARHHMDLQDLLVD